MSEFRIEHVWADYHRIMQGDIKVAIIFPADGDGRLAVYPNPDEYPGLTFAGLPAPLLPEWMKFGSLDEIADMLGIAEQAEAA